MIRPSTLIEYMRTNRSSATWQVDYGVNYVTATDKSQLKLPCFYVEINDDSAEVTSEHDYEQLFRVNIRIRLVCKSQEDRMGRTGAEVAYQARLELYKILLFKKLDARYNEIYYSGGGFEGLDEARYIHTFNFFFTGKLDPSDLTIGDFVNLESIYIDYDLVDSVAIEQPNAQDVLDTFQD